MTKFMLSEAVLILHRSYFLKHEHKNPRGKMMTSHYEWWRHVYVQWRQ